MKLSELIEKAEDVLEDYGDLDVGMLTDTPDALFSVDLNPEVDVIEVPLDQYSRKTTRVFAVMWKDIADESEEIGE